MLKHDFGHMGCPYYEEELADKTKLIFIPRKSELKSALVYVGQGGFNHAKMLSNSKIPFGSAYYLMNMVGDDAFVKELRDDATLLQTDMDYSFVRYQLTSMKDIFPSLKKLLLRMSAPTYMEKDIEAFKQKEEKLSSDREKNPILLSQEKCLFNLYTSSPIRYGYLPSLKDGVRIHESALKKYQENYYSSENITIFLSMDASPEEILTKVKEMKVSFKPSGLKEEHFEYEEDYEKVGKEYEKVSMDSHHSYLTYGIKFPSRAVIYDAYGEFPFAAYEILLPLICKENAGFLSGLGNIRANLLESRLEEGGEDAYILLTFQSEDEVSLINYLTDYFSKLDKQVTSDDFYSIQKAGFMHAVSDLSLPCKAVELFSKASANNMAYTALMARVDKMSFNTYRHFLSEFKAFRKAVCYVKKGK